MNRKHTAFFLAFGVALCFLLVSTTLLSTSARHQLYVGHDHTTHKQAWCGWLCAGGHGILTPSLEPTPIFEQLSESHVFLSDLTGLILTYQPHSRGPPVALT